MFASSLSFGQGMDFFHGSFEEALQKAQEEDKAIFVDAYTSWCGPCKRMSKNVFPQKAVGDYYNANFINLKMNMEKEEGMKFGLKYPVTAYPTFYYIKPDGEVLFTTKGGRQAEQFIALGQQALNRYDRTSELEKLYQDGDHSFEVVYDYIKALNRSGKSSLKVANDYLNEQTDLSSENSLKIINEAAVEADSRIFELLIDNKEAIMALISKENFEKKVRMACLATVDKAVEHQYPELLSEAQTKFGKLLPKDADRFNLETNMVFYSAVADGSSYQKNAKKYIKKYVGNNSKKINDQVSVMIEKFQTDEDVMTFAEKYAQKAAENGGLSEYYLNWAYTLYFQKKYAKTRPIAEKALELATEEKANLSPIRTLISKLDQL
jgi:thiol-disulfide isomerase/thioredoxin